MLASGADVEINSVEYSLTIDEEEPYAHWFESLYGQKGESSGEQTEAVNKAFRFFVRDSFHAGSGQKFYDPENPGKYWKGSGNPRGFPGSITSAPDRTTEVDQTLTFAEYPTSGSFTRPARLNVAGNSVWVAAGQQAFFSSDNGLNWSEDTAVESRLDDNAANYIVDSFSTGSGIWIIFEDIASGDTKIWSTADDSVVVNTSSLANHYIGATLLGYAFLYKGRTGSAEKQELYSVPIAAAESTAITLTASHLAYTAEATGTYTATTLQWEDIVAGDLAVYFFTASDGGETLVHEYRPQMTQVGAGRPIWRPSTGFVGQALCYHMGKLFIAGKHNGLCALYGYDTETGIPFFAGYIGEGDAVTNVASMSASFGSEIMILTNDGTTNYVYIYNIATDAFSTLDSISIATGELGRSCVTSGSRRLISCVDDNSTDHEIYSWSTDKSTPTGAWTWEDVAYDFDTPYDGKTLLGFHVVNDPAIAAGTLAVQYLIDEDTGTGYSTALTTVAGSKHSYLVASTTSSTKTFRTLRMKVTGASGARMLSITPRVYINTYQEMWRLKISTGNESDGSRRIADRARKASALRDALFTLAATKQVVAFKDGRRYSDVESDTSGTGYTAHSVVVEDPVDFIDSEGEGFFQVTLRSIVP